jgi:hypothetical protein
MYVLMPMLALGLIGDADAGSPFERGIRTTFGPSLPKDSPPESTPPASTPAPAPSAAEQATAAARAVVQKVDPTMKGLLKRQEPDPNQAKNAANAAAAGQPQTSASNKQEKKIGAGTDGAKWEDASKEVHQLQRGLFNDQKVNVGSTQ